MGFLLVDVEIVGAARAVVGADEVNDALWDMALVRQLDAIGHMRDDDFGTLDIGKVIMWAVGSMLVLSEIHRILNFSDVVIQGTRTSQLGITTDFKQDLLTEISHLDGMLEGAWRNGSKLTQQRAVGIAQLHQRERGGHAEDTLKQQDERLGKHGEQAIQQ